MAAQLLNLGDFSGVSGMGDASPSGEYPDMYGFGAIPPGAEYYNGMPGPAPSIQYYLNGPATPAPSRQYYSPHGANPASTPGTAENFAAQVAASFAAAAASESSAIHAEMTSAPTHYVQPWWSMAATATISGYGAGHGGNVAIFPGNPSNGNSPTGPNFTPHNWDTYRKQGAPTRQNPVNPPIGPTGYDGEDGYSIYPVVQRRYPADLEWEWMIQNHPHGNASGMDIYFWLQMEPSANPNLPNINDELYYWGAGDSLNA